MKEISLRELLDTEFTINDKLEMVGTFTLDRINMISDILTNLLKENEELNNIINEIEKEIETFNKSDFNTNNIIIFGNNIINIMKEGK